MLDESCSLTAAWELRNAAAGTLLKSEEHVRRLVQDATLDQLVHLLEAFSPARSAGPDWTRSFEPLIERLWVWRDAQTLAALEAEFRARGGPWVSMANALSAEHGQQLRAQLRQPAWARQPAFTLA